MLGIVIGVMALITVISVMNGFEQELRNRILGMVAHASISGVSAPLDDWQHVVDVAPADKRVLGAAPYAAREAMRSEGRRGGKEGESTWRCRWAPYNERKKTNI